jgi:hypothetical protein
LFRDHECGKCLRAANRVPSVYAPGVNRPNNTMADSIWGRDVS